MPLAHSYLFPRICHISPLFHEHYTLYYLQLSFIYTPSFYHSTPPAADKAPLTLALTPRDENENKLFPIQKSPRLYNITNIASYPSIFIDSITNDIPHPKNPSITIPYQLLINRPACPYQPHPYMKLWVTSRPMPNNSNYNWIAPDYTLFPTHRLSL